MIYLNINLMYLKIGTVWYFFLLNIVLNIRTHIHKKKRNGKKTVVAMERKFAGYARKFSGMFAVICTN